jgi:hypothetical protein
VIQLASVFFSHATRESPTIHTVKKNVLLLMDGLIDTLAIPDEQAWLSERQGYLCY